MIQFGTIKYGIQFRASAKEKVRHQRGESSGSCSEEDGGLSLEDRMDRTETHMCPRCHEQFQRLHEFIHHKRMCDEKALQMGEDRMHSDPEDMVVSGDEEMDEPGKRLDEVQRHRQDAENNNSLEEEETEPAEGEIPAVGFPFPAASHVTLEALQNTKVAVAQFAATALANDPDNEAARQELEVLQSTLFTLQHQQVFQLQLIQQLQNQLLLTRRKEASSVSPPPSEAKAPTPTLRPTQSPSPSKLQPPQREPTPARRESPSVPPTSQSIPPTHSHVSKMSIQEPLSIPKPLVPSPPIMTHPPYSSISSSLASTIITNNDPPPSLNEPNTLEMLQKRAQEVLDNASQGLLANNLADELAFRKSGKMSPYDGKSGGRNEPFFKHRCRYCGKVFGSDSALQIHIRSHTGERPFKCNVCGSRFTTKGNLKVHFQRHTAKFPHVKMNPNPIPEHLDKYHPPILAQMSPGPISGMPPHPMQFPTSGPSPFPPGLPMYRPPHHDLMPPRPLSDKPIPHHALFALREEQDRPADLSKPTPPSPLRPAQENRFKTEPHDDDNQRESIFEDNERLTPKHEPEDPEGPDGEQDQERYPSPSPYDDCSTDSKYSNEDMLGRESPHVKHDPDQPENLSSKNSSITGPITYPMGQRIPPSPFFFPSLSSPPSSTSSGSMPLFHPGLPGYLDVDPTRDPTLFNSLLPRPGSNDNSWESLIEITKTSETSKLQQLVDNIENKLTDPNQCVICQRVLSCKSALQMHYRTHTGERPFRCRICGRAFTTKGNLKTHMGVHRMKPPSQLSHQCPVCHKRFTNSLILQQHIRLHTGEPTDISPEQIQAAELRESPVSLNLQTPGITDNFLSRGFPFPGFPPPGFVHDRPTDLHIKDEEVANEEDDGDYERSSEVNENQTLPFSASLSALENQVMTITTMASQLSATGSETQAARSSPLGSPSARRPLATPPMMPATPPLLGSPLSSLAASVLGGSPFSPLGLALGPAVRGNTTCNICYKTFACNSALEIHYRSHTKERPFKCTVCDRGFSTKSSGGGCRCGRRTARLPHATALNAWNAFVFPGNMKQHMLTHKIRDMPPHGFDKSSTGEESRDDSTDEPPLHHQPHQSPHQPQQTAEVKQEHCAKRSPPNIDMPLPKRPSVGAAGATPSAPPAPPPSNKHLCGVCRKNFSSSSALQIHMRTHTGDKPFRCAVCQKAFTTKGNLKVHMGTHMWSSGASRRGRRMSLELPPRPALEPHELLRRPDLFYPYLPAPFLNGMQQKLNEISVIQQNAGQNGMGSPGAKFPGLLGFGSFPPPPQHSQPGSPLGDGAPPSLSGSPPRHASPRELAEREALLRELAERDRDALLRELAARARDPADHEAALREMAGRAALERDRELALAAAEKPQEPTDKDLLPRMWDLHYERKAAAAADASGERLSPGGALALIPPPAGQRD